MCPLQLIIVLELADAGDLSRMIRVRKTDLCDINIFLHVKENATSSFYVISCGSVRVILRDVCFMFA